MTLVAFAAIALCVILAALAVFQAALIAGAPLGEFAWGGADRVLPRNKRAGSVVSIVLYCVFAWFFLMKAALVPAVLPGIVVDIGVWVIVVYSLVGIVMNAMSRSPKERWTMVPVAALLFVLGLVVALG
ncbi:hypothetical protein [Homoserinimonas hongtaonis]|uniref:DUF1304 domain-containing protein n=1 Tax=Homoserinimonas hongtaonis TaxID=2079791 RepID=A0A2U1T1J9_9MICO|nr:hypothetical protein [Salinibacterium hongtaonis]PWB97738.1 hypothetical protein DF220_07785 [Salinibacterium hongtaonis]